VTTREAAQKRIEERAAVERRRHAGARGVELLWLLVASIIVVFGLSLVYLAKTNGFADLQTKLDGGQIVNVNGVIRPAELLPYLGDIPSGSERLFIANQIASAVRGGKIPNVGALGKIRATENQIHGKLGFETLAERMTHARPRGDNPKSIALLTPLEIRNIKPFLTVRSPAQYRNAFLTSAALFLIFFFALHVFWRYRGFAGDNLILPAVELLCGVGLMLMISLRDPLRDTLMFTEFTQGVLAGCVAMAIFSQLNYDKLMGRYSYVFLLATAVLGLLLASPLGTGPGTSDAKVNLFFFQPVEIMRILIVFFLAGYFAANWDVLRDLRHKKGWLAEHFHVPRLDYALPVVAGVVVALAIFFVLKDNGPALVIGCLFLILYAIARKRVLGALLGFAIIALAFYGGHLIRYPKTVADRVDMWESPWRNTVSGGDQIAHSVWALSTGAGTGTGLGLGSPSSLPAGHTDLILSAAGEELGFLGLLGIFLLYGLLTWRSLRIALRARSSYSFFLAAGLALIVSLQLILIAGGLLGLLPLSGVVSPFLSFGKTSMVANFITLAIILAVSSRGSDVTQIGNFGRPIYVLVGILAFCGIAILGRTAYFQLAKPDQFAIKGAEVRFGDKTLSLAYNPRLHEILQQLPKGDVLDRNGLPLATNTWETVERHSADYQRLGVAINQTTVRNESRHYPLGPEFFYLVGDERSTLRRGASNTAFLEHDARTRLQGFDDRREVIELHDPELDESYHVFQYDYSELVPLLRHRHEKDNPQVKEFIDRQRDVKMSIDSQLQLRASAILRNHLSKTGNNGAIVVLDPATGDLLAAVSYPWPEAWQFASFRKNPDRAMEAKLLDRARFGLYPPGSSFKIVTAIAALRLNPALAHDTFECKALDDGRVGNYVGKSKRPIRDDVQDRTAHGVVDMAKGITVSCNAYFAQLGFYKVGAQPLLDTARQFGIAVARPNTPEKLKESLPQASYGQGQVVASPFQMARVAATVANNGKMPQGRWIVDESNTRIEEPATMLTPELATQLAGYMRAVVVSGTGRVLHAASIPIAGKTGTAELAKAPSHAWFIGFAPYGGTGKKIAFAILVENGRYGGTAAAPIAGEIVQAAKEAGLL
jgi:cell division protein FtsI/penicillin-binding protein 2/cell division protein FtsW (lipid II flippase)